MGWGREAEEGKNICNYNGSLLMYGKDYHSTVKQLSSNKKKRMFYFWIIGKPVLVSFSFLLSMS